MAKLEVCPKEDLDLVREQFAYLSYMGLFQCRADLLPHCNRTTCNIFTPYKCLVFYLLSTCLKYCNLTMTVCDFPVIVKRTHCLAHFLFILLLSYSCILTPCTLKYTFSKEKKQDSSSIIARSHFLFCLPLCSQTIWWDWREITSSWPLTQ